MAQQRIYSSGKHIHQPCLQRLVSYYVMTVILFLAGGEVLPVSWRASDEDAENVDLAPCCIQVRRTHQHSMHGRYNPSHAAMTGVISYLSEFNLILLTFCGSTQRVFSSVNIIYRKKNMHSLLSVWRS